MLMFNSNLITIHKQQENRIVHGKIRCSTLQVIEFIPNERFIVKLGDPGLPIELNENDVPWIAVECYEDLSSCRKSLKSDIWAYSTTIWEIFSRGAPMNPFHNDRPMQFFRDGRRLPKPAEIVEFQGIYELIQKGWDLDPDKRFPPQTMFSCLLAASKCSISDPKLMFHNFELIKFLKPNKKYSLYILSLAIETKLHRCYSEITNNNHHVRTNGKVYMNNGTLLSRKSRMTSESEYNNGSMMSSATDHTFLTTPGTTQAYIENCGSSIASNQSNGGSSSQVSLLNGSEVSASTMFCFDDDRYFGEVPGVLEFSGIRVVFQGSLGSVS